MKIEVITLSSTKEASKKALELFGEGKSTNGCIVHDGKNVTVYSDIQPEEKKEKKIK